ncbi:MAG: chorismate-binding protein [Prevotella sp.]
MSCFALYRLPHSTEAVRLTQTAGRPDSLQSYTDLSGREGFVFAPFTPSADCPILIIHPDRRETISLDTLADCSAEAMRQMPHSEEGRESYAKDFNTFHERLCSGEYSKLVLARHASERCAERVDAEGLFIRACQLYPRMFVALVSTPESGTWLMATPEILLEGRGDAFATMALAGSQRLEDSQLGFDTPGCDPDTTNISWDEKNIEEQQYVASYIKERIGSFADDIRQHGPYTARAGRIVHLRTDFRFTLRDIGHIGRVIDTLHPTPAVCGIPKDKARRFIIENETGHRLYYSGFCGPLCLGDETHLYVSLRCMEIKSEMFVLYAGGGLLDKSEERHEWEETQYKMDTMRLVINSKQS